jgi:hypothetical protein
MRGSPKLTGKIFHRGDAEAQSGRKKQHGENAEGAEVTLRYPDAAFVEDSLFSCGEAGEEYGGVQNSLARYFTAETQRRRAEGKSNTGRTRRGRR